MPVKALISSISKHPRTWAVTTATATHVAGAAALLAAEFGAPAIVLLPLLGWHLTIGLPTTVAVVLTAAAWGVVPGLWGLWSFLIVAAVVSYALETLCFVQIGRFLRRILSWRERA